MTGKIGMQTVDTLKIVFIKDLMVPTIIPPTIKKDMNWDQKLASKSISTKWITAPSTEEIGSFPERLLKIRLQSA